MHKMRAKGFPNIFIKWIEACIQEIPFSIIINDGFFPSSDGIRQGYPLSSYFTCIAMDDLSYLLDNQFSNSSFVPIISDSCRISHLLYIDDLITFDKTLPDNLSILKDIFFLFSKHVHILAEIK